MNRDEVECGKEAGFIHLESAVHKCMEGRGYTVLRR